MAQQIVVNISPNGTVEIDAKGFTGSSCAIATHELEVVLSGGGKVDDTKKPEFYAPAAGIGSSIDLNNRF